MFSSTERREEQRNRAGRRWGGYVCGARIRAEKRIERAERRARYGNGEEETEGKGRGGNGVRSVCISFSSRARPLLLAGARHSGRYWITIRTDPSQRVQEDRVVERFSIRCKYRVAYTRAQSRARSRTARTRPFHGLLHTVEGRGGGGGGGGERGHLALCAIYGQPGKIRVPACRLAPLNRERQTTTRLLFEMKNAMKNQPVRARAAIKARSSCSSVTELPEGWRSCFNF